MTDVKYDAELCDRLIAEVRKDEIGTNGWVVSWRVSKQLRAMADQLAAARAEIDSLRTAMEISQRAAERRGAKLAAMRPVVEAACSVVGFGPPADHRSDPLERAVDAYRAARDKAGQ